MYAAAEGKSRLGIPKDVGEEFIAADATNGHACGTLYVAPDGDVLVLRRSSSEENYAGHWALPGGVAEDGETPEQTAQRESDEEVGDVPNGKRKLLDSRVTPNGMAFHTYAQAVGEKFVPKLNDEHSGYAWAPLNQLPEPLHPGFKQMLGDRLDIAADMSSEDWDCLRQGFAKWTREEEGEPEHGEAMDSIAMDRNSIRRVDQDGHLFVEMTPISKANICPYYGKEIPNAAQMGLDPERVYKLYRDPKELAKAAGSFAGKPILLIHTPVSADEHPREVVIGSVGNTVEFKAPYLMAPLNIWDGEAIELIETDEQKELSCGYRYRADMTSGTVNGETFDGIMRDIGGNHVALVREGRAGPDVVIGDSAIEPLKEADMAAKNTSSKAKQAALTTALTGVLAQDANIDEVVKKLMALDDDLPKNAAEDEDDEEAAEAMDGNEDDKVAKAEDESEEDADKKAEDEEDDKKETITQKAMDSAIQIAVKKAQIAERKNQRETFAALEFVRPYVGNLAMAHDSADDVFRTALSSLNVDIEGVHPSAFKAILKNQPLPGSQVQATPRVAMDAKGVNSFHEMFPAAKTNPVKTL